VLTAQTLGSYSNDPSQVEKLFDQYSAQSGFAGWIKTFEDKTGTAQLVEIAIRFHDSAEAQQNATAFVSTLSKGLSNGTRSDIASIPGAVSFVVDESATTSGTISIPAQQVQAVVFSDADYFVAIHTDSPNGSGSHPIASGTAVALALAQYQHLSPVVRGAHSSPVKTRTGSASGSTARTVGLAMLGAVVIAIAVVAVLNLRHRRRAKHRQLRRSGTAVRHGTPDDQAPAADRDWRHRVRPDGNRPDGDRPDGDRRADWAPWPLETGLRAGAPGRPESEEALSERAPAGGEIERTARAAGRSWVPNASRRAGRERQTLVGASTRPPRVSRSARSERLASSRTNHPSGAIALVKSRPSESEPGWYVDPSDERHRRIRYWDGSTWTTHVAEPQAQGSQPRAQGSQPRAHVEEPRAHVEEPRARGADPGSPRS